MRWLYTIGIVIYGSMIRLASIWIAKAKLWVRGRKNILGIVERDLKSNKYPIIWIHSASLGEFEQARPIIEELKKQQPIFKILVTFFSPSGYEIRKNYELADFVYYLPEDTTQNARQFLKLVQPHLAIFVKYEFWYNYMQELNLSKTPLIFISAIFRPSQVFFQFYGGWFLKQLQNVDHIFVQTEESEKLLKEQGLSQVSLTGDTRFDRVVQIAKNASSVEIVERFKAGKKLFLGGSTWPDDERIIQGLQAKYTDIKMVIAPHLIDESHLLQIEKVFSNTIRYSKASIEKAKDHQVLIIDNMGMLSSLYQYADFAMIGGGFGVGIHNTLEAATFGMPIFIGPNYQKFQEARDLIKLGVIKVINNEKEFVDIFEFYFRDSERTLEAKKQSLDYIRSKAGATDQIYQYIQQLLS